MHVGILELAEKMGPPHSQALGEVGVTVGWHSPTQDHIRDVTDSLIKHYQDDKLDENANIQVSDDKITEIVLDLFGAGMSHFPLPAPSQHAAKCLEPLKPHFSPLFCSIQGLTQLPQPSLGASCTW